MPFVKRIPTGRQLTAAEHDGNIDEIIAQLAGKIAEGDPRLTNARPPTTHTHTIADVTSLQSSLDAKSAVGHTHTTSNITNIGTMATETAANYTNTAGLPTALGVHASDGTQGPILGSAAKVALSSLSDDALEELNKRLWDKVRISNSVAGFDENGNPTVHESIPTSAEPNDILALDENGDEIGYTFDELGVLLSGKNTIWFSADSLKSATTGGAEHTSFETTTNKINIPVLAFATGADEYASAIIRMPKSWNEGPVKFVFVWAHDSTTTNFDVTWGVQGVAFADNNDSDVAWGTPVTVSKAGGTTKRLYFTTETADVTIAGSPGAEELVVLRFFRDVDGNGVAGDDDLAIDAWLVGVAMKYVSNSLKDD
jgi:hypothetical protein